MKIHFFALHLIFILFALLNTVESSKFSKFEVLKGATKFLKKLEIRLGNRILQNYADSDLDMEENQFYFGNTYGEKELQFWSGFQTYFVIRFPEESTFLQCWDDKKGYLSLVNNNPDDQFKLDKVPCVYSNGMIFPPKTESIFLFNVMTTKVNHYITYSLLNKITPNMLRFRDAIEAGNFELNDDYIWLHTHSKEQNKPTPSWSVPTTTRKD